MVDYEQTLRLIKLAQKGDKEAKDLLIKENYPLVKSVIKRYIGKNVEYDDLFQLGCVGFVKAINNFDENFGVRFSTYAVPMIAGEVKRFLRDDGYIKVSRAIKSQAIMINRYIASCRDEPDIPTIARALDMSPEDVIFAMDSARYPVSLSAPIDSTEEGGATLQDKITDLDSEDSRLDHFILKQLIRDLSPRERKIIIMRYYHDKTQSEIASLMGISQVQVSRIENKVLSVFRKKFNS